MSSWFKWYPGLRKAAFTAPNNLQLASVLLTALFTAGQASGQIRPRSCCPVFSLAFSADGKMLAVGSDLLIGCEIRSTPGLKLLSRLKSTIGRVSHVSFSSTGKVLAVGGEGGVELWDVQSHERQGFIFGINSSMAFRPTTNLLAVAGADPSGATPSGLLETWNITAGKRAKRLRPSSTVGPSEIVSSVSFSEDGKRIVAGIDSGVGIEVWDVSTGKRVRAIISHFSHIISALTLRNGQILMVAGQGSAGEKGLLEAWDVSKGRLLKSFAVASGGTVGSVAFTSDGTTIAIGGRYGTGAELWSLASGRLIRKFNAANHKSSTSVAISPDGRLLAIGCDSGTLDLWDISTWRLVAHIS